MSADDRKTSHRKRRRVTLRCCSLLFFDRGVRDVRKYTKEEAISIAVRCAEKYRDELEGRNLLFLCTDKHKKVSTIELSFYGNNYMHLTGLKPNKPIADAEEESPAEKLFANDFYQKCLDHKLSPSDVAFAEDGTTHMKLDVLPDILCKNLRASMIGDFNSFRPRLYTEKVVGGTSACMGFVFDQKLLEYIPNTVIKEDTRNITSNYVRVIAAYRKRAQEERYTEITYKARKVDWAAIRFPDELLYLKDLDSSQKT